MNYIIREFNRETSEVVVQFQHNNGEWNQFLTVSIPRDENDQLYYGWRLHEYLLTKHPLNDIEHYDGNDSPEEMIEKRVVPISKSEDYIDFYENQILYTPRKILDILATYILYKETGEYPEYWTDTNGVKFEITKEDFLELCKIPGEYVIENSEEE
jgi:hypothetical protein